ncbi:transcriptional regulator [Coemansia sp. RSA 988]|nr:transcriptional regulator [Coemansia sp. RSA 988]
MNGRQDSWSVAAAASTENSTSGRNSISYDRATPLGGIGSIFGGHQAQQFAHAQQQQSAAAAYMQQHQLRQQQQGQQDPEPNQPRPDMSDFPSLGSPPGLESMASVNGAQLQANQLYRTIAGARPDRQQGLTQRPSLTPDDFPALSKSIEPGGSGNEVVPNASAASISSLAPGSSIGEQTSPRTSTAEHSSGLVNGFETTSAYKPPTANLAKAAGSISAQRPIGAADRFGMLGILTMNDYGFDVSKFGLSLPSSGALYPTFGSPWTDQAQTYGLIEPDFKLPACYNASRPPPAITKIPSLMDESLFYVFYTMPQSELQLAAAEELYRRQWRYHKELRLWLTKDPETQPTARTPRGEQGVFIFFDPGVWQKVKKEFLVLYELLEDQGALTANAEAAGTGMRSGAQSVPPSLQQLQQPQQSQPLMAHNSSALDQTQLQNPLRLNSTSTSQQQQQQQLMMMVRQRQQESSQGVGSAYNAAIAGNRDMALPLRFENQPTSAGGQSSSNLAEDVAAASMS